MEPPIILGLKSVFLPKRLGTTHCQSWRRWWSGWLGSAASQRDWARTRRPCHRCRRAPAPCCRRPRAPRAPATSPRWRCAGTAVAPRPPAVPRPAPPRGCPAAPCAPCRRRGGREGGRGEKQLQHRPALAGSAGPGRVLPIGALEAGHGGDAEDPGRADGDAGLHRGLLADAQQADLPHVAVAVANPNLVRALRAAVAGRSTGELQGSRRLGYLGSMQELSASGNKNTGMERTCGMLEHRL